MISLRQEKTLIHGIIEFRQVKQTYDRLFEKQAFESFITVDLKS